eukprot:scaffold1244_cov162-Ochromonas_danica.AAC.24
MEGKFQRKIQKRCEKKNSETSLSYNEREAIHAFQIYRHFPELRQSLKATEGKRFGLSKPVPGMENKVVSFARCQSPTLYPRPQSAPRPRTAQPSTFPFRHNQDKIFALQQKMTRLQRQSCFEDIQGLQHVRRVILHECNEIRKSLLDSKGPTAGPRPNAKNLS